MRNAASSLPNRISFGTSPFDSLVSSNSDRVSFVESGDVDASSSSRGGAIVM